jgi:anti-anti-sigma factor
MLSIIVQDSGNVAVLGCEGRIVAGHEVDLLRSAALSRLNRRTVVLDLTRVETIDGGGIGLFVFLQGWARAAGIELKLRNPTQHVHEMLKLTNLDSVFEICLSDNAVLRYSIDVGATEETTAYQRD